MMEQAGKIVINHLAGYNSLYQIELIYLKIYTKQTNKKIHLYKDT